MRNLNRLKEYIKNYYKENKDSIINNTKIYTDSNREKLSKKTK